SAQVKNGKLESFFGYNANNFAWYNPANGKMELFMYAKNGQLFIRDLFIEDGSITNAKIGNVIQSNNYVAGKSGWIINKNGYAEFDNAKFRGEIKATKGTMNNVIIDKDCEIKGTLKVENIEGDIVKFYSIGNGETITIPPQSFDRVIQVIIIATTHNSKWCRLWLNDDKFFEIKKGGRVDDFYYWNSPSTTLKANTPGVFRYDSEDRYFKITLLACKQ
uniref:phage tail tip fiber protein n=1 Tax=Proteus sp. TJ1640 TaxID=2050968 RepID=UPI0013A58AC7